MTPVEDSSVSIHVVGVADLEVLLPLVRAYCDFYEVSPRDDRLIALSRALIDDPTEGSQLLARGADGTPLGFATVFWTWQTLDAARVGVLNDLYTVPEARGKGIGRRLIEHSLGMCRKRGAAKLYWETATDNETAQRLYDSLDAESGTWKIYEMEAW